MVRVLILYIICYTVIFIVTVNGNHPGTVDGQSSCTVITIATVNSVSIDGESFNIVHYMLCYHYHSDSEWESSRYSRWSEF